MNPGRSSFSSDSKFSASNERLGSKSRLQSWRQRSPSLPSLFHAGDDTAARALASLGAGEREVRAAITAVAGQPGPIRPAPGRGRKPGARDDEIRRLRREVARLNELLREHGIEPGEGDRKSA